MSQPNIIAASMTADAREKLHASPPGRSAIASIDRSAKEPLMTAPSDAPRRPVQRRPHHSHASAASPVRIATGSMSYVCLVMATKTPLTANTKVNDPKRRRKALFSRSAVATRMADCARIDATPRLSATQESPIACRSTRYPKDCEAHGSINGCANWVANVSTDRRRATDISGTAFAVASPRRAAARTGPLTITAAAAISMRWGGVNRACSPIWFRGTKNDQKEASAIHAAPNTRAAARVPM